MTTLLRTPDAAQRLGVSASFLEKQRCLGTGPAYIRLGRSVAYRECDIESWVASQLRHNTSQSTAGAGSAV